MTLSIQLPPQLEAQLRVRFGDRLDQEAKEALAIELYRESKLSIGQLAQMLDMGVIAAEEWLAQRGVELPITVDDLTREMQASRNLLKRK